MVSGRREGGGEWKGMVVGVRKKSNPKHSPGTLTRTSECTPPPHKHTWTSAHSTNAHTHKHAHMLQHFLKNTTCERHGQPSIHAHTRTLARNASAATLFGGWLAKPRPPGATTGPGGSHTTTRVRSGCRVALMAATRSGSLEMDRARPGPRVMSSTTLRGPGLTPTRPRRGPSVGWAGTNREWWW